jgi:hypothetical protein
MTSAWIWIGLAIMVASQSATLAKAEPFYSWNTPIAWTGFILFADAIVYRRRRNSWLRSNPREFAGLALVSIPLWVLFEGYNLVIRNWHYVGLPANMAVRYVGYAWSFATIWPALFEGAELLGVFRSGPPARPADPAGPARLARPARPALPALVSIAAGALMLASPFFVSPPVARYLAAPVWLGFIFLLDPLNAWLGAESLWTDWRGGRTDRLINLVLSGFLCGALWEFWNYWSRAKWHYTVPIMEHLKIFEMPVPGYFGFPAFALECFTMYVFVRAIWQRSVSRSAGTSGGVRGLADGRAVGL